MTYGSADTRDIELQCKDCQKSFLFSEKSQELYTEQGWDPPIRCYDCRQLKKARHEKKITSHESSEVQSEGV